MTEPSAPPFAAAPGEPEQRSALRRPAALVPGITGLRISPHGIQAALVNISETGLLAECGERITTNSAVTVFFEGTFDPRSIEGRIARVSVSAMGRDGRLQYHVGIAFARLVDLKPHEVRPPEQEPAPAPSVVPPFAPVEEPELDVEAVIFEPGDSLATEVPADDPSSIEFEVSFPSEEVVRNRW